MVFDYSKLRGKIKERNLTEGDFAKRIGIGRTSLYKRLSNQQYFTQDEMLKSCEALGVEPSSIPLYFFAVKV